MKGSSMVPKIGVVALGRSTFDTVHADEVFQAACTTLQALPVEIVGGKAVLYDANALEAALPEIEAAHVDALLIIQVTFTDAELTVKVAKALGKPVILWSWPEARTGGRLRLNSFCGVNLASHAFSRNNLQLLHVHQWADAPEAGAELLSAMKAAAVVSQLRRSKVLVIGEHPAGFDACNFTAAELQARFGVQVDRIPVLDFIAKVAAQPDSVADAPYARRAAQFANLKDLDHAATIKSLKIYAKMSEMAREQGYDALAVRCWPDFFTDYGAAACGAMALMNEDGIPCGCEADLYGTVTSLILRRLSGTGVFNTDLVDVDPADDTVVFWHCGQAPIDMADPEGPLRGTIHSNRKLPLLSEFALKPGVFTLARISQGGGALRLLVGSGEMLRRPLAFSGTAGVARMAIPATVFMNHIMEQGLEHHSAVVYGQWITPLQQIARLLQLETIHLTRS